ncbi:ChrR family anti-sigma-E factor [Eionea flava]
MNTSPQHHPDKNLLIEYAAGTLETGPAIAISSHLHYCSHCRNEVNKLEQLGGALLSTMSEDVVSVSSDTKNLGSIADQTCDNDDAFTALMSIIDKKTSAPVGTSATNAPTVPLAKKYAALPKSVKKMMQYNPVNWRRVTRNLHSASLVAGQDKYAVSLQKIRSGGQVPQHDHNALEMTVVLKGSFSDEDSVYQQGDFLLKQPGDKHQPMASSNEDCLCLSVELAPVKLTSMVGRLINPFLRITPA